MTWGIWWTSPEHSKILKFALWEIFLSKLYNVCTTKLHGSYVSWNWRVSSQKSENLHFDRLILSIANKDSAIKSTEELSLMTQNFEENLTFCLKNDFGIWEFGEF